MAKSTTTKKRPPRKASNRGTSAAAKEKKSPKRPAAKRGKSTTTADSAKADKIVEKIRKLQEGEFKSKIDVIHRRIEIGRELNELKEAVTHGQWAKRRDEVGYEQRIAQILMKLANDGFADKIRSIDTDLQQRLPIDVYKLDTLNRLSAKQLNKCLTAWGSTVESMNRAELRAAVNAIVEPKTASEKARQSDSASDSESSADAVTPTKSAAARTQAAGPDDKSTADAVSPATTEGPASGDVIAGTDPDTALPAVTEDTPWALVPELLEIYSAAVLQHEKTSLAVKEKQISKETAKEAITQIDKTIQALSEVKKRLAKIK